MAASAKSGQEDHFNVTHLEDLLRTEKVFVTCVNSFFNAICLVLVLLMPMLFELNNLLATSSSNASIL